MEISTYLQGRQHNSQLLNKIAEEHLDPAIEAFNADNERCITAEWSMSAKYQSITINFEMADKGDMSDEAIEEICFGTISEIISEWFAAEGDEDDARGRSYFSVDIGL